MSITYTGPRTLAGMDAYARALDLGASSDQANQVARLGSAEQRIAALAAIEAACYPRPAEPATKLGDGFQRLRPLDWMRFPAHGKPQLDALHFLAADLFARDHDAGTVDSPSEATLRAGEGLLTGDPADPGFQLWRADRRRDRAYWKVAEREKNGELNFEVKSSGSSGARANSTEDLTLARAWRLRALDRRLGADELRLLKSVILEGESLRALAYRSEGGRRAVTRRIVAAFDSLIAVYEGADEDFAQEAACWRAAAARPGPVWQPELDEAVALPVADGLPARPACATRSRRAPRRLAIPAVPHKLADMPEPAKRPALSTPPMPPRRSASATTL